jgi:hypothetical protein
MNLPFASRCSLRVFSKVRLTWISVVFQLLKVSYLPQTSREGIRFLDVIDSLSFSIPLHLTLWSSEFQLHIPRSLLIPKSSFTSHARQPKLWKEFHQSCSALPEVVRERHQVLIAQSLDAHRSHTPSRPCRQTLQVLRPSYCPIIADVTTSTVMDSECTETATDITQLASNLFWGTILDWFATELYKLREFDVNFRQQDSWATWAWHQAGIIYTVMGTWRRLKTWSWALERLGILRHTSTSIT